jgi:hypothetical protein
VRRCADARLVILLVVTVTLFACYKPTKTSQEVAAAVLANPDWVTDAKACPADVMPSEKRADESRSENCEGGAAGRCLARCRRDDADACYWLAQELLKMQEEEASKVVFQRACILGVPSGCTNRAAFMKNSRSKEAQACAASTFRKTCEAKDPWGCTMYGNALHHGLGAPHDDVRALGFFEEACAIADPDHASCARARVLIEQIRAAQAAVPAPE